MKELHLKDLISPEKLRCVS